MGVSLGMTAHCAFAQAECGLCPGKYIATQAFAWAYGEPILP